MKLVDKCLIFALFILLNSSFSYAGITILDKGKRYKSFRKRNKNVTNNRKSSKELMILQSIKRQNSAIESLLNKRADSIDLFDETTSISLSVGTVIRGVLLNSIRSTEIESPISVVVIKNELLPVGSRFECLGATKEKTVQVSCSHLVIGNEEYEIKVKLLELSGSLGLQGIYYDGKEEHFVASVGNNFFKGVLEAKRSRLRGSLSTEKALIEGGIDAAKEASDLLKEEAKAKVPIVFINSGKEVLIYFERGFKI